MAIKPTKTSATTTAADPRYDALIAAWNNPTQPPPSVTGSGLLAADTTDAKIVKVNAWTVTGAVPRLFYTTGAEMLNCIDWAEFGVLTADKQANVLGLCQVDGQLAGGMDAAALITGGMFVAYFGTASKTIASLTKLAKAITQPWWQASVAENGGGLTSPVSKADTEAAGLV